MGADAAGRLDAWLHPQAPGGALPDPVGTAIPVFFPVILLEVLCSWHRARRPGSSAPQLYSLRQTISNLSAGVLMILFTIFLKGLHVLPYLWLAEHAGRLPRAARHDSWWLDAAALLACDVCFYLQHRFMHATNLGWSAHVVHHSSPDFNLSTALRQGAGEGTFSWLFYLPLALFCPPEVYALHRGLNTVYQFFTHTQLVGRLWWPLELVLNTPSHHRVHHARNYPRSNFAGMLIVWDRLFGTFEPEQPSVACLYGLDAQTKVQGTYNPLLHQVHHAMATLRLAAAGKAPLWSVLFTRRYGPGMVHPAVTDTAPPPPAGSQVGSDSRESAPGSNGSTTSLRRRGSQPAPSTGSSTGGVPGPDPVSESQLVSYPWERRCLGALDYYAAGQFFLLVLPSTLAFLVTVAASGLSPAWVAAGACFLAWTVVTVASLCSGEGAAVEHELVRVVAQVLLALGALSRGALPHPWPALAGILGAMSCACTAFLLGRLTFGGK